MIYVYKVNSDGRCYDVTGVDSTYVLKEGEKLLESEEPQNCYTLSSKEEQAKDDWGHLKPADE
tara:strand:- start:50 stop:238 length:189 start_codon:yes stop_codon:yes gene_type:complete